MTPHTETLQIANLALLINAINGTRKVSIDFGGTVAQVSAFVYPTGRPAPELFYHAYSDEPDSLPRLRYIRHELEKVLAEQQALVKPIEDAA